MKNQKTKVLVIVEDGRKPLEAIAKTIKTTLVDKAARISGIATSEAIPEILAADAYAFGVGDSASSSWAEIKRLLTGMNLAGRKAGFFVETKGAAVGLKAAFEPAELSVADRDLVAGGQSDTDAWILALLGV
ncbi:MAG TPA: hypothetical protein PLW80_10250 [Spirochaetales bacterium]|nr:hypothetical protein [Spirochaetales bacterium]